MIKDAYQKETLLGHPTGLYTLFFAEMWERFSYYGMRALLVFYMIKGFLGYGDSNAYAIYGSYTALVYMTPFFGGMLADRLLGARRAVILGGLLMAAGHLMMTVEQSLAFFVALALLIVGNGFFKPNISSIVGMLYPKGSAKRDAGFTIFYMGINLGAAMSPLLCGYIGETYGWHKGFGLATIGMLTGLAVFVAPTILSQALLLAGSVLQAYGLFFVDESSFFARYAVPIVGAILVLAGTSAFVALRRREESGAKGSSPMSTFMTQLLVMAGAVAAAYALFVYHPENVFSMTVYYLVGISLVVAAIVSCVALQRAGLPDYAGAPPDVKALREPVAGILSKETAVYLGALLSIPVFTLFVSGFEPVFGESVQLIPNSVINRLNESDSGLVQVMATVVKEISSPAGLMLVLSGMAALVYLLFETFRLDKVRRERMFVVLILTFFSILFWSFFEQAGSSVNNFTDRNVDRVFESHELTSEDVGKSHELRIPLDTEDQELKELPILTQEFLGHSNGNEAIKDQIATAVRVVEKEKIESGSSYAGDTSAHNQAVAEVWAEVQPQAEQLEQQAKANSKNGTALEEAQEQLKADIRQKIEAKVAGTLPEFSSTDAKDAYLQILVDRVLMEARIASITKDPKLTITGLTYLRTFAGRSDASQSDMKVAWTITEDNVGVGFAGSEIPASVFQSVNPIYILIFGLVFSTLWGIMNAMGIEPSTPVKFALGLLQLGVGFGCFWYGAITANTEGMVALVWLFLGYMFQTTGELCLSPVGLAMVTRLSPARLVSTVMGNWFLATAFSQFLAAIIAQFTGTSHGGDETLIPVPSETVNIYGDVFKLIAIAAIVSGVICLALSPILKVWMHEGVDVPDDD